MAKQIKGKIPELNNEPCIMVCNGYWVGKNGRHISSYERVDKEDFPVFRQYSMDRHHNFYIETED